MNHMNAGKMIGTCALIGAVGWGNATLQAQVTLQEIATVNLDAATAAGSNLFIGSHAGAIAWNGTSVWVSGYNGTADQGGVAVVHVTDLLGTPTFGPAFGHKTATAFGGYSGLDVQGDTLLASFDTNAAAADALTAFNTDGTVRWTNGDAAFNYRGVAGPGFDPGFNGTDAGVSHITFGSGRRYLFNTTTGANIYNASTGGVIFEEGSAYRDHDYDPVTGDLYIREDNNLQKAVRLAGNEFDNAVLVNEPDFADGQGQNLAFMTFDGLGDLIIYNSRTGFEGGLAFDDVIRVVDTDGNAVDVTFNFLAGSIGTGNAYYDFDFDFESQTLAVLDFTNNNVHIFAVPEPASLALLGVAGLALWGRSLCRS